MPAKAKIKSLIKGKQTFSAYLVKDLINAARNAWNTLPESVIDLIDEGRLEFEIDGINYKKTASESNFLKSAYADVLLISNNRECQTMDGQRFIGEYNRPGGSSKDPFEKKENPVSGNTTPITRQMVIEHLDEAIKKICTDIITKSPIQIVDEVIDNLKKYVEQQSGEKTPAADKELTEAEQTVKYGLIRLRERIVYVNHQLDHGNNSIKSNVTEIANITEQLVKVVEAQSQIINKFMIKHEKGSNG